MKNVLSILLAMFVGMSVVGCGSYQKIEKDSHIVCDHLYSNDGPVGCVDLFYTELTERMKEEGFKPLYSFRGSLFGKEFTVDGAEHILYVEVSVVTNMDSYGVLTKVPYFTVSLKRKVRLGTAYKCVNVNDFPYLFFIDTFSKIIHDATEMSKSVEEILEEAKGVP